MQTSAATINNKCYVCCTTIVLNDSKVRSPYQCPQNPSMAHNQPRLNDINKVSAQCRVFYFSAPPRNVPNASETRRPILHETPPYTANSLLFNSLVWRHATQCFLRFGNWPSSVHKLSGTLAAIVLSHTLATGFLCVISLSFCRSHIALCHKHP